MYRMTRSYRVALATMTPIVVAAAGCTGPDDCTVSTASCGNYPLEFVLTPPTLTLAVGDTASVGVTVTQRGRPTRPVVRWTAGPAVAPGSGSATPPAAVAIDSTTATQARVRLRGLAAGLGYVQVSVSVEGQTVSSAVPVTVVAR